MAVTFEGFSIREYAAKMRSVNLAKCWPFSGDSEEINGTEVESLLPPITVTKFRWWANELNNVTNTPQQQQPEEEEEEEAEKEEPKINTKIHDKRANVAIFTAQKKMASPFMKAKSRAPKKRSIVEIFAVAPQIEKVVDDDDDDSSEEGEKDELNVMKIGKKKRKVEMVDKLMNKNRKKRRKKKKKKKKMMTMVIKRKKKKKKLMSDNCKQSSIANKVCGILI